MVGLPAIENLAFTFKKCSEARHPHRYAVSLYKYLYRSGQGVSTLLRNHFLEMLLEVRNQFDSKKDFDTLVSQAECSFSSLICSYIRCGNLRHAISLCGKLEAGSLDLDERSYVLLLKTCATVKNEIMGCKIHAHLGLMEKNLFVGTALLDMYAKCGTLVKAQEAFDKLTDPDVVAWNALISGYAQHAHGETALEYFEKMQLHGISPDVVTFACSLKACGSIVAETKGTEIHGDIERRGLFTNIIIGNALVDMYAKCGAVTKAQDVFDMLPVRNVISWTALVGGYAQQEHGEKALEYFEQMQMQGVYPDAVTYACGLKACGSTGAADKGRELHADIERKGFVKQHLLVGNALIDMYAKCGLLTKAQELFDSLPKRDVISWTSLISGYIQTEEWENALKCYDRMKLQDVSPNDVTFSCVLKVCGNEGALEKGEEMHAEVKLRGLLKTSQLVGNSLIDMYAKCGMLLKAQEVFDSLHIHDIVSWTVLLTGYAQVGEVMDVLAIFNRMIEGGIKPNAITFVSILNACSHSGLIDVGFTCFIVMEREYGLLPSLEHHTCIIDILGRAGQLERAVRIMKKMPSYPNIALWLTILGACKKWGDVELGKHAFEQALLLDEKEATAYVCMHNIYSEYGIEWSKW